MSKARTLRTRLLLWISGPLLALWVISTLVDHDVARGFVNLNYDRALLDTAMDLGRNVRESNNQLYLDLPQPVIEMLISGEQGRFYYRANGPGGEYITGDPDLPDPPPEAAEDRVTYYNALFRKEPIRAVALRVPVRPGSGKGAILIQVAERSALRDDFARQIMLRMMMPQGILVLLSTLTIWFGLGLGLRALTSMRREIESRSHIDLSPIDEAGAPAEVQPLVRAMNDLLSRLSAALAAQQRFIADAAHQLRTPVAALKMQAELATRQVRDGEAAVTLQQLQTAADHAARLVGQLLTLARAEPGSHRSVMRQPVALMSLARDVSVEWVPRALARQIDLGFDDASAPAEISADPFLIHEMLNNLIDNAIQYTPAGGRVTVRVRLQEDQAMLEVEDDGPGIPVEEREKIFERFYRMPGGAPGGCGLGLAIVREIAQGHQATVAVQAGAGGRGTCVTITFPAPQ
ncbi:MAG: sensor histidine kinase N-terminal domain-containing protein [Burkholderiales bacterium]|jgi:two-component system, OmpR family, sensor histidine kinase TctE|nr:sensor histidine kinase N-terminal domain-containing protein [Burkholderiales bacterium]